MRGAVRFSSASLFRYDERMILCTVSVQKEKEHINVYFNLRLLIIVFVIFIVNYPFYGAELALNWGVAWGYT